MANVDIKEEREVEIPTMLPVLPVRDMVIFPYMILPLFVGRDVSIKAIDHALSGNKMILLVTQKDLNVEEPTIEDLYEVGTVGTILRILTLYRD
jgi:ATP-dependent Lon protease